MVSPFFVDFLDYLQAGDFMIRLRRTGVQEGRDSGDPLNPWSLSPNELEEEPIFFAGTDVVLECREISVMSEKSTHKQETKRQAHVEAEETKPKEGLLEELKRFVERSQDVIYRYDIPSRRFVLFNKAAIELYGIEDGAIPAPKDVLLSILPEDRDRVRRATQDSLAPGCTGGEVEYRQQAADGSIRWMNDRWIVIRDPSGRPVAFEGIVRNETKRKQAEEALRRSEALLNTVEGISKIGGWEWDVDRQEMFWTKETYRIHDFDPDAARLDGKEYIARSVECYAEEDRSRILSAFRRCVEEGEAYDLECRFTTVKGRPLWIRTTGRAVRKAGRIVRVVGNIQDITDQKRAEEEREKLQDQLQQSLKMESIGRLAGGVAHDYNNMLGVIIGHTELAMVKVDPTEPLHADLEEILKAAQRSVALTRQLLAFSRKQTLQPEVLDLNSLLQNLEKMLRRLIGEDIELELPLSKDIACVTADPGQIEQVIMNLAVNARDAMPRGGKLIVETANVDLDASYAQAHASVQPGKYVMLAVTDTGCGMDKETLSQIFDPFFTTKEKEQGTGLGLSTVYGIVKQSGGNIWAYSEPGQGTIFKIYLPRTHAEPKIKEGGKEKEEWKGGGQHILVVEDEKSLRTLVNRILSGLGYRVSIAANGGEALLLVEEKGLKPELVITDVIMPGMSGSVLAKRLRRVHPDLKVLYMSGYTDNAIFHHGVLDPGRPFIQKPFNIRDLAVKVRELLRGEKDEPSVEG